VGGMLLPKAAHPVPDPRMVSNEVSVVLEHHVVPAALLMALFMAVIAAKALYCEIAVASAVGMVLRP